MRDNNFNIYCDSKHTAHSSYGNSSDGIKLVRNTIVQYKSQQVYIFSTRDLAWSSNICFSRDGQILGQSVGEDSDSRRVTAQQLSNKRRVLRIPPCSKKENQIPSN